MPRRGCNLASGTKSHKNVCNIVNIRIKNVRDIANVRNKNVRDAIKKRHKNV